VQGDPKGSTDPTNSFGRFKRRSIKRSSLAGARAIGCLGLLVGYHKRLVAQPNFVVFAGRKADYSLSYMAMLSFRRRMKRDDITVHGFRSTFRDWAAKQNKLAHAVGKQSGSRLSPGLGTCLKSGAS
jgi:hypothetical protein